MSKMRIRTMAVCFTTVMLMILSGCVGSALKEPLEITLADIELGDMTLTETTFVADVRIVNPNTESLNFNGTTCKLYLGGGKVGTGLSSESFVVDRLSTKIVKVQFHVNNLAAAYRLHQIQTEGVAEYKLKTILFSEGSFGVKKIRNTYEGKIDLNEKSVDVEKQDQVD